MAAKTWAHMKMRNQVNLNFFFYRLSLFGTIGIVITNKKVIGYYKTTFRTEVELENTGFFLKEPVLSTREIL